MEPNAPRATRICARLLEALCGEPLAGELHSVFDRAANIETAFGLVSVLGEGRSLQPNSVLLNTQVPFPRLGWERGLPLKMDADGIYDSKGAALAMLSGAEPAELSIYRRMECSRDLRPPCADPIVKWLEFNATGGGLAFLVTGRGENHYTAFVRPRVKELFCAIDGLDVQAAAEAASRIAGCGPGLTPSSDDLLCGAMAALHAYSATGAARAPVLELTRAIAASAAKKTNRISAAFLLQSGDGYAGEDVTALIRALFLGVEPDAIYEAAAKLGGFGSTSGEDMLTGIVLAIIYHSYWRL